MFRVLQTATKDGRETRGSLERFWVSQTATKYTREGGEKRVCGNKGFYKQQQTN